MRMRGQSGRDPHVGEGAIDETAQSYQGTVEYGAGSPVRPHVAAFKDGNGEGRAADVPRLLSFVRVCEALLRRQ